MAEVKMARKKASCRSESFHCHWWLTDYITFIMCFREVKGMMSDDKLRHVVI